MNRRMLKVFFMKYVECDIGKKTSLSNPNDFHVRLVHVIMVLKEVRGILIVVILK